MRLVMDIKPLAFRQVLVPMPTDEEIKNELYGAAKRKLACTTADEKKSFVRQWKKLIDKFADIIKREIQKHLYAFDENSYYQTLANRLKNGIEESILKPNDGLLPHQPDSVFVELKTALEAICLYCKRNPNTPRIKSLLRNLYTELGACGPGFYMHITQAFYELYQPKDDLFYWLAELREKILREYVQKYIDEKKIDPIYHAHVYTAFADHARQKQWHLLQENTSLKDFLIITAIPISMHRGIYEVFERNFIQQYKNEAIDYLSEQLTNFIVTQFNAHAVNQQLSFENNDFFKTVTPVLDSFQLSLHLFLKEDQKNSPVFHLKHKTLLQMKYYIAISMQHLKLLNSDPLILLTEMSSKRGHITVSKHFVDAVSDEEWFWKFQCTFNFDPPESYSPSFQRRAKGPGLFGGEPPFERLLRHLGCTDTTTLAEKLKLLFQSEVFRELLTESWGVAAPVYAYFCKKYEVVLETNASLKL